MDLNLGKLLIKFAKDLVYWVFVFYEGQDSEKIKNVKNGTFCNGIRNSNKVRMIYPALTGFWPPPKRGWEETRNLGG